MPVETQSNAQKTRLPIWVLTFAFPAILFIMGTIAVLPFEIDDSYISLHYASNLATGNGLVFNAGGPHLEGYTNFLLVALESLFVRLGLHDLLPVKIGMIGVGLLVLATLAWYGGRRLRSLAASNPDPELRQEEFERRSLAVTLCTVLVATASPLLLWTVSGLETTLFVLMFTLGLVVYLDFLHRRQDGKTTPVFGPIVLTLLICSVAVMARPEGLLFWAFTTLHAVIFAARSWRERLTALIASLIGFVPLAVYGAWKLSYFGQLLPATFYAKQQSLDLINILGGGAKFIGFLAINGNFFIFAAVLIGLVLLIRRRVPISDPIFFLAALAGCYLAYTISLGFYLAMSDSYRFYVPLIPLSSLILLEIILVYLPQIPQRWITVSFLVIIAMLIPTRFNDLWTAWRLDLNWGLTPYHQPAADVAAGVSDGYIALGKWLKANAAPNATIVLWDAGAIPYYSGLRTIDTWSLTDMELITLQRAYSRSGSAAEREDLLAKMRSYVLAFKPNYIIQDGIKLLDDPTIKAQYKKLDTHFMYMSAFICAPQTSCNYPLDVWQRQPE